MNYHILLTGATGLLGRYLLKDLLLAEVPVAVVVRRSRRLSAQDRVDALMATWDKQLGVELPRPKVLDGDLCDASLGLSDTDLDWVSEHCDSVLHNAASLTFIATDPEGEPWRSNVHGTRNVLDVCRQTGIKDFHHVSTSYVCGLRTGRILESELDVGQARGNAYEESKIQAETMVREADFLSPPTIYRPAIIVGDAQNGFTTTFHGFYAALNLACTLAKSLDAQADRVADIPTRITLDGTERKNFVPVDWVSAVTAHIVTHPQFHGRTFHLTPTNPVTAGMIREVLEESYHFRGTRFVGKDGVIEDPTDVEKLFYEHIHVYNSYWRDDPTFDCSNTQEAAPHLPCPTVDKDMLLMLAHKAIEMDFRFKDKAPARKPVEMA